MAKKFLQLPGNKSTRPYLINGIELDNDGVSVTISGDKNPYVIKVRDAEVKKRIKREIEACVEDGASFKQPDWTFVDDAGEEIIEE